MTCSHCTGHEFRHVETQAFAHYECQTCLACGAISVIAERLDISRPWGMFDHMRRLMISNDLQQFLRFTGFDFAEYYTGEEKILRPQLEALGFTSIRFFNIERDSFGPLVRGCDCVDASGQRRRFSYA